MVIDEEGNVLSAELSLTNNSDYTIDLLNITVPEELSNSDWEALIEYGVWDEDGWHDYYSWFEDYDWDEAELSSSDLTTASSDANASTSVQTASDVMTEVNPGATATGTWSGTTVPSDVVSTVKSNGSATLNFKTSVISYSDLQPLPDVSIDESYTYTGSEIIPTITGLSNLKEGTDYTVEYKDNVNAGTASAIITGKGYYRGTKTLTFTIAPKEVTITWSGEKYTYNAQPQGPTATISGTVGDDALNADVRYSRNSSKIVYEKPPTDVGVHFAEVVGLSAATAGTNIANYKLPSSGKSTIFFIQDDYFIIVYHGNGGSISKYQDTYVQYCPINSAGTLETNHFKNDGKTFAFWTVGSLISGELTPSTLTCEDGYTFNASGDKIVTSTTMGTAIHLYAYWKDDNVGNFWINKANAADPQSGAIYTEADVKREKRSTNFWRNVYNSDQRLYTYWNGDDAIAFGDRFAEFRVIQVGEHMNFTYTPYDTDTGDGSTVTFAATHSLPTAQQMNTGGTNRGGWGSSYMRNTVFGEGGYVQTGLSGLADEVTPVEKSAWQGYHKNWSGGITTDKFWLLSFTEFGADRGSTYSANYFWEGRQYDWFASKIPAPQTASKANAAFEGMGKTRSGLNFIGEDCYWRDTSVWWLRSPSYSYDNRFAEVNNKGQALDSCLADDRHGVVPAFAF